MTVYHCFSDFPVKFESSSYVFTEGDGQKRTSIALVKDATVETELSLSVSVNIDSTRDNAKSGTYYMFSIPYTPLLC